MRIDPSWVLFLIQEYPLKEGRVIVFIMFYLNPCQASCNLVTSYIYVYIFIFFSSETIVMRTQAGEGHLIEMTTITGC